MQMFYSAETQKYWRDIDLLRKTSLEVIETRKNNPTDKKDLLNGMLKGVDPKTGKKMTVSQCILLCCRVFSKKKNYRMRASWTI